MRYFHWWECTEKEIATGVFLYKFRLGESSLSWYRIPKHGTTFGLTVSGVSLVTVIKGGVYFSGPDGITAEPAADPGCVVELKGNNKEYSLTLCTEIGDKKYDEALILVID